MQEYEEESELLKTIRIPRNLMYLSNRLPMANYDLRGLKKNTSQFKLNRSINVQKSRAGYIASSSSQNQSVIEDSGKNDLKLPTL